MNDHPDRPPMDAERWQRLKALLADALEQPPAARDAFAAEAAAGDAPLLAELRRLLAHHTDDEAPAAPPGDAPHGDAPGGDAPGDRLRSPLLRWRDEPAAPAATGERIGAYRLVREIGRGGMGAVYLAERADGQFAQQVAIKLVRSDAPGPDVLARFAVEQQVLARLEHPHIARLYGGGVTPAGRPYVVMEYVDGLPLTDYCAAHALPVAERLRLFLQAVAAVAYAHRNLVVHRDLKPSNILVTARGGPEGGPSVKLLDFGIAKLLGDDEPEGPHTQTGLRLMTPEYAAPEQVRGEPVTTATDVYGLGVLLYELLVGHRPFRLAERLPHEVEHVILEEEPTRPSTAARQAPPGTAAARPADLARRLAGDLDTIVLKALRKEPERRYASAEALADDVRRHLEGLPVAARPDTLAYRASRFARRHRVGVAATAAVVLALLGGLGAALWQARTAAAERDRARAETRKAEGALDFLTAMIVSGGPREGDPDTPIGVVLDSAAARVGPTLAGEPEVARAVYTALANVFFEMGRLEAAAHNARRALALFPAPHGLDYARAAHALAVPLGFNDSAAASIGYHEAALAGLDGVPGAEAQRASILNTYAHALVEATREADAEAAYREALALLEPLDHPDLLYTLNGLGVLYLYQGRFADAVPVLRQAVERLRRDGASYELGEALGNLAGAHAELGQIAQALAYRREGLALVEAAVGEAHPSVLIQRTSYASDLLQSGRVAEARREAQRAVEAAVSAFGPDHSYTAFAQNVAGQAHCRAGDAAAGVALLRASLATRKAVLPEGHWLIPNGQSLLGDCLARLGRPDEAEALLVAGLEGLRAGRGPDHKKTAEAEARLRAFYAATGRPPSGRTPDGR